MMSFLTKAFGGSKKGPAGKMMGSMSSPSFGKRSSSLVIPADGPADRKPGNPKKKRGSSLINPQNTGNGAGGDQLG